MGRKSSASVGKRQKGEVEPHRREKKRTSRKSLAKKNWKKKDGEGPPARKEKKGRKEQSTPKPLPLEKKKKGNRQV